MNFDFQLNNVPQRLVTAIVPIHNMANRLSNLFSWMHEADKLGFQIILVCNNSIDETKSQLEDFIEKHDLTNVTIVDCEEIGPGAARNYGMRFTEGEFTVFWDADDIGYPEKVFKLIKQSEITDVLVANYRTNHSKNLQNARTIFESNLARRSNLKDNLGLWRCIFKSTSIKGIDFGQSRMGEDQVFFARFLITNPLIEFSIEIVYQYFIGVPNQLTSDRTNVQGLAVTVSEFKTIMRNASTENLTDIVGLFIRLCFTGMKRGKFSLKVAMLNEIFKFAVNSSSIKLSIKQKIMIIWQVGVGTLNVD